MKWEMEVEEEKEIEAVLEKIWDLHDKLSDAIHSITRAHFLSSINKPRKPDDLCFHHRSKKRTGPDSDQNAGWKNGKPSGFVFVKEFRVDEDDDLAAVHEAKSLNAIRTALENLEDQLEFFHTVQTQQRVERDVALARLEQSRIILAMRLADHKGQKYKFIEEAQALVGDVRDASHFVSPESLFGSAPRSPGENSMAPKGNSNILLNVLLSSFKFVKKSLRVDHVGGILGNAALVAFSMLALMHMQQAGCKERHFLDYPPRQEDALHNQTHTKVSQRQDSSSSGVKQLDVLSARG
ncbi:PREDICTED: plastid division protein PDV1-like [Ipomoea nil]|uniref:plastid division protein PDV1-like n=1 Tax=Ipomoea nil TaxID=35883 RepID=UPI000900A69D|nr:PREDICTED: plastid division protein PDV1-like [Ipomoea nil]